MSYLRRVSRKVKSKKGKKRKSVAPNLIGLGPLPDPKQRVNEDRRKDSEPIHQPSKSHEDKFRSKIISYLGTIGKNGAPKTKRNKEIQLLQEHFKAIGEKRRTKLWEYLFGHSRTISETNIPDTPHTRRSKEQREQFRKMEETRKQRMKDEMMASGRKIGLDNHNDRNEIEADEMAEKVMGGMFGRQNQKGIVNPFVSGVTEEPVSKAKGEIVSAKGIVPRQGPRKRTGMNFAHQLDTKAGKGSPLPTPLRAFMERKMGADFAGVRVHTDAQSAQMSKEISAQAFTYKKDIYFNAGKYNPDSHEGKKLLAHELTHVMQQDASGRDRIVDRKAEGGGGKERKRQEESAVIPMDKKVTPADYAKAKPQEVPNALINQAKSKIKGSEDLKIVGEMVIVYSPCYSSEIYTIMHQVNNGEVSFEEGKTAIMDRLVYLLTHDFENAEGVNNPWAKDNLKGTTQMGADNKGADWYKTGNGGPKMFVLTAWNHSGNPDQGGSQDAYFFYNEPKKGEKYDPEKPVFQEYGNPMVSSGAKGYDREPTKARFPGNPLQIELLLALLSMLSGPSKLGSGTKGAQETLKKMTEVSDALSNYNETEERKEILDNKVAQEAEKEMIENTRVKVVIQGSGSEQTMKVLMEKAQKLPPNSITVISTRPEIPTLGFHSAKSVSERIRKIHE